ncbi:DNA ligase [Pseudoxanthomonas gei]|uniref:DNA ligase n=1 Tax=Pseudoxanthomonas gei TaxID=1383030 RepID=A0ABX0AF27_9GAMM|nr:DNA ligase [Pseudoxanthomonas gei]NDK37778.1 DNA ligase [Pseudoxanthomonas gei]
METMHLRLLLTLCLSLLPLASLSAAPPPLMLATEFRAGIEPGDYWISEKLDGVRGRWDGQRLFSRSGQRIAAPAWFIAGWPKVAMDGELWIGRGRFDEVSGIVRAGMSNESGWRRVRFMVFDLPGHGGPFEARVLRMRGLVPSARVSWLQAAPQFRLGAASQLESKLRQVIAAGGEGLMLHRATALYQAGRSEDLLKYKAYQDAEATVVAHAPGKGKYTGMLGALVVRMPDGRQFRLGSGFTDLQRARPPPLGSLVTYRYNGLTSKGLPRFARFQRIRIDPAPPDPR